jgi:hypothetical protein
MSAPIERNLRNRKNKRCPRFDRTGRDPADRFEEIALSRMKNAPRSPGMRIDIFRRKAYNFPILATSRNPVLANGKRRHV